MPSSLVSKPTRTALTVLLVFTGLSSHANATEFRYSTGVNPAELRLKGKTMSRQMFESGMSQQILKLQKQGANRNAGFDFTSINVVEDCSASVTCGDGTKIECSVQGPGTCESGMVSVACITANTSQHSSCPAN